MSTTQHVALSAIQPDKATQIRAEINHAIMLEYAEAMAMGTRFPRIDLFPEGDHYLIGDGWHRFLAYQRNGDVTVEANVHDGGRIEAIKFALGANARHGLKRTNADKRRAVEIALKEFSDMSDRAIAEMCGVSHVFVSSVRPKEVVTVTSSPTEQPTPPPIRKGLDGKTRKAPVPKPASNLTSSPIVSRALATLSVIAGETVSPIEVQTSATRRPNAEKFQGPTNGLLYARNAIAQLEKIEKRDQQKAAAFELVRKYLNENGG